MGCGVLPATAGVGALLTPLSPRLVQTLREGWWRWDGTLPTYHPHAGYVLRDHLHSLNLCFPSGPCPPQGAPRLGMQRLALREFHTRTSRVELGLKGEFGQPSL